MLIRFWGTRGSLPLDCPPSLLRRKLVGALLQSRGRPFADRAEAERFVDTELEPEFGPGFGGATPCVEVRGGDDSRQVLLLDAGSGLAAFGRHWKTDARSSAPATFHILLSHLHWDHIQGIPFFAPAYAPGNRIVIHSCHGQVEAALRAQMDEPFFPVPLSSFAASVSFEVHKVGEPFALNGFAVDTIRQNHPGVSYGYRLERDGKALVYSTDAEHAVSDPDVAAPFVRFFRNADLLIFEAMFTRDEVNYDKAGWGHASSLDAVELAALARARRIALFHHDPAADDDRLAAFEADARRHAREVARVSEGLPREVFMARDGMELAL